MVEKKRYKILVIGDQNTGKTSIIHRYVKGEFLENQQLTVGPGISCKEVSWENDLVLKLEFCDIGGKHTCKYRNNLNSYSNFRLIRRRKESFYDQCFLPSSCRSSGRHGRHTTGRFPGCHSMEKGSGSQVKDP